MSNHIEYLGSTVQLSRFLSKLASSFWLDAPNKEGYLPLMLGNQVIAYTSENVWSDYLESR